MADDESPENATRQKKGLLVPLVLGLALACAGGAGGYWAVTTGPLASQVAPSPSDGDDPPELASDPVLASFVPLETVVISLGPEETARHLIFTAELEVDPDHEAEVTRLSPRVLDVLNSYLRVISIAELSDPASLGRLRAQMLRRIQVVTGAGRVRDLLVTQFVVN